MNIGAANLLNAIPEACLIVDLSFNVIHANPICKQLFPECTVGQHITELSRNPDLLQILHTARDTLETHKAFIESRAPFVRRIEASVTRLDHADALLVYLRDLTEAENVERMRVNFVADASHELRTPLASIIGFVETMQGAAKNDPAAQTNFLGIIHAQAGRMQRLISDLLSLSRIELSEHQVPTDVVDLVIIAQQAIDTLRNIAAQAGVEISFVRSAAVHVPGDRDELIQSVQNLVENAIKYAGDGRRVEISARAEGKHGVVDVRDFGTGIDAHHIPRLTERFYRVDQQGKQRKSGTGLGLAIVKHIVNKHRGRLSISSEKGSGSIFSISIPLVKSDV